MAGLFKSNKIAGKTSDYSLQSTYDAGALIQKNLERTALLVQSFKQVSVDQVRATTCICFRGLSQRYPPQFTAKFRERT